MMRRLFVYLRVCSMEPVVGVWIFLIIFFANDFGREELRLCMFRKVRPGIDPFLVCKGKRWRERWKIPDQISNFLKKGENSRRNTFGEIWASPERNLVTKKCSLWSEGSRDRVCRSKYIEIAFLLHQSPNPTLSVLSFRTTVKLVSYMRTDSVWFSRPTLSTV